MKTAKSTTRRKFLAAAGVGGAGAVAVAVTARKSAPAGGKQASAADAPQGYRVTDHVRKYYKTTEV